MKRLLFALAMLLSTSARSQSTGPNSISLQALYDRGEFEAVRQRCESTLATEINSNDALYYLALANISLKDNPQAFWVSKRLNRVENTLRTNMLCADALIGIDMADQAIGVLENAYRQYKLDTIRYILGKRLRDNGHSDRFKELWGIPFQSSKYEYDRVLLLSEAKFDEGDAKGAVALLRESKRYLPEDMNVDARLAFLFDEMNESDSSLFYYERYFAKFPTDTYWRSYYIGELYDLDSIDRVLKETKHFLETEPDDYWCNVYYGRALYDQKKFAASARVFEKLISQYPSAVDPILDLSLSYVEMKRYRDLVRLLHKGLALDPSNARVINNLGAVYTEMGSPERAIGYYRDALKLNPSDSIVIVNLASALIEHGREAEGFGYLLSAIAANPTSAYYHAMLGNEYFKTGNTEMGESQIEVVRQLDQESYDWLVKSKEHHSKKAKSTKLKKK